MVALTLARTLINHILTGARMKKLAIAYDFKRAVDLIGPEQHARLAKLCDVVNTEPLASFDGVDLTQVEILLTSWGCPRLDAGTLARAPALRMVAYAAGTVKPVVSDAFWERGIAISSAAAANAIPVAEYALAMILLANKHAFALRERYRRERDLRFPVKPPPGDAGNYGAVVGIIGASRTGRRLIELLRPFALEVIVSDPYMTEADAAALRVEKVALDDLLQRSRIVSLHAPITPETLGMIGVREFGLMRDGATFINTARGVLVDHAALAEELRRGRITAVLDVTWPEPLPADSPLFDLAFITPHIAGGLGFETRRMTDLAIDEIERHLHGEPLQHRVTRDILDRIG
jgi:phosphoglycerate dehydrogenase-like enzyme